MHTMLADSIDGGILAILIFLGGLVTAVLALCALVPAWQGNRASTFTLAGPAFVFALLATCCLAYWWVKEGANDSAPDPDSKLGLRDFIAVWVIMAGPALVTSSLAICVLWLRRLKVKG
ncbi:MAG TPA: hypothetical protein VNV43_11045 [Candidatus Acidoferrales bacterium]|nr:hypothetical protein [Candidatus Acidoferrales bacterium]